MDTENYNDSLAEPLKSTVEDVLVEFCKKDKYKNLHDIFDKLEEKDVEVFFNEKNIPILADFKKMLISPFAIGKYLILLDQQEEIHERLKKLLRDEFDTDEIVWLLKTDLSNTITFIRNDERRNCLVVRYVLNEDDTFRYYLNTSQIGWQVSFDQLKAILTSNFETYAQGTSFETTIKNKDDIVITVGNKTIVIKDHK